jgi:cysteine desulfurase/selenocysteine lyase
MEHFGVPATVRASLALYNTREEIDSLVVALHKAIEVFS